MSGDTLSLSIANHTLLVFLYGRSKPDGMNSPCVISGQSIRDYMLGGLVEWISDGPIRRKEGMPSPRIHRDAMSTWFYSRRVEIFISTII